MKKIILKLIPKYFGVELQDIVRTSRGGRQPQSITYMRDFLILFLRDYTPLSLNEISRIVYNIDYNSTVWNQYTNLKNKLDAPHIVEDYTTLKGILDGAKAEHLKQLEDEIVNEYAA